MSPRQWNAIQMGAYAAEGAGARAQVKMVEDLLRMFKWVLLGIGVSPFVGGAIIPYDISLGGRTAAVWLRLLGQNVTQKTLMAMRRAMAALGGGIGRAAGGPVSAGLPYLVGERGPEMFVPDRGGNIVPNGAARSGGSYTLVLQFTDLDSMKRAALAAFAERRAQEDHARGTYAASLG